MKPQELRALKLRYEAVLSCLKDEEGDPLTVYPEWEDAYYSEATTVLGMGGEGSGKSYMGAAKLVPRAILDAPRNTKLYWLIGDSYRVCRKEFSYTYEWLRQLDLVTDKSYPDNEKLPCVMMTKFGQRIVTVSGHDPTNIARDEPDGIVGCEVAQWPAETFKRALTRLVRKMGTAWGFFTGSFETSLGHIPDYWKTGQGPNELGLRSYSIPAWANHKKYPLGRQDPGILRAEATLTPTEFQERFGGQPAPSKAIIFQEFRYHLHVDPELKMDPNEPVYLAIDPGSKVYCVLFVQYAANGEVWVLDEIYVSGMSHEQIVGLCRDKPGWWLIVKNRAGTIDVAAKQAHMGMPVPIKEWQRTAGLTFMAEKFDVDDTISALHHALSVNPLTGRARLRIHPNCQGLICELGGGGQPLPGAGPWRRYETAMGLGPPQPHNDHSCKALAYNLQLRPAAGAVFPKRERLEDVSGPVSYMGNSRQAVTRTVPLNRFHGSPT